MFLQITWVATKGASPLELQSIEPSGGKLAACTNPPLRNDSEASLRPRSGVLPTSYTALHQASLNCSVAHDGYTGSLLRIDEQAAFFISLLAYLVITIVNRAAIIEQLKQTQEMLAKLLALLEAGAADKCAAHLYQPCRAIARHVREAKQGQQRHRTRSHLKLSGRAESGIRR